MRKLFILLLPILLIVGCSSNSSGRDNGKDAVNASADTDSDNVVSDDQVDEEKGQRRALAKSTDENDDTGENSSSRNDENNDDLTNKEKYTHMLEDLEDKLDPLEEKAENGDQKEMEETEEDLFERWDVALNEVYDALERDLSDKEMEALRKEQRKWINKRDKFAKRKAEEYKGGSLYGFALIEAKKEFTIDRCYELVENYMD